METLTRMQSPTSHPTTLVQEHTRPSDQDLPSNVRLWPPYPGLVSATSSQFCQGSTNPMPHGATRHETLTAREDALRKRHICMMDTWSEHTRRLPPLRVGDHVRMQNQTGPHPTRWDKTGTVIYRGSAIRPACRKD